MDKIAIREGADVERTRFPIACFLISLCLHLGLLLIPAWKNEQTEKEVLQVHLVAGPLLHAGYHTDGLGSKTVHPVIDRTLPRVPRPSTYNVVEISEPSDLQPYSLVRDPEPPHPIRTTGLKEFADLGIELPEIWDSRDSHIFEPAMGLPRLQTGLPGKNLVETYLGALKRRIEVNKAYPAFSRRKGEEGRVVVSFSVNCRGGLESADIVESSGYVRLDEAAIKAVRCSSPFPPPPCADRKRLMFSVVLAFELAG